VVAVEVTDGAGLTEMFNPERQRLVTRDRAKPGQGGWMTVQNSDDPAMRRQAVKQSFDMGFRTHVACSAGALGGGPACVQPIRRRHRQHSDVAASLRDGASRLDRLGRHCALVGDHHIAVRAGLAQPVGPINGSLAKRIAHALAGLFPRLRS